jgi:exodeoxyribonuclease VII small subunit
LAKDKEPTFKEAIEELEKITDSLESGELELEQSLALFERGVELIKYCQDKLDSAQAKVELLVDSLEGEIKSVPLDEAGEDASEEA